jgi:RNA 2',3'-cyclic 3'-phosphodiesterase
VKAAAGTERARLFYALWPDEAVRGEIARLAGQVLGPLPGRPVPARNLHLTLAFLHSVPRVQLPALLDLGARLALPPLELELDRWGWFERPRVLWLGPSRVPPALAAFERTLWQGLAPLGFAREHAQFRPHVTLRRKAVAPPAEPPRPVAWPVRAWALVESQPGPGGSVYSPLAQWPARHTIAADAADSAAAGPRDS